MRSTFFLPEKWNMNFESFLSLIPGPKIYYGPVFAVSQFSQKFGDFCKIKYVVVVLFFNEKYTPIREKIDKNN